jgi:excisionase family DNA binding protein
VPSIREFERWLTTGQAARKLRKTRQGVTWLVENGRLRAARTQLGWLIDPKAIDDYAYDHYIDIEED